MHPSFAQDRVKGVFDGRRLREGVALHWTCKSGGASARQRLASRTWGLCAGAERGKMSEAAVTARWETTPRCGEKDVDDVKEFRQNSAPSTQVEGPTASSASGCGAVGASESLRE